MYLHTDVSCCASLPVHVSLYVSCSVLLCVSRCTCITVAFLFKLRWLAVKGLGMWFGRYCHDDNVKSSSIGAASDKSAASAFGVASSTGATGLDIAPATAGRRSHRARNPHQGLCGCRRRRRSHRACQSLGCVLDRRRPHHCHWGRHRGRHRSHKRCCCCLQGRHLQAFRVGSIHHKL